MSAEAPPSRSTRGTFKAGVSGNPKGRPRKARTVDEAVAEAMRAPVAVTENGRKRKISKLHATATQIANQGAQGDLRAGKMALDLAHRAEEKAEQARAKAPPVLTESDEEIVARLQARIRLIIEEEDER